MEHIRGGIVDDNDLSTQNDASFISDCKNGKNTQNFRTVNYINNYSNSSIIIARPFFIHSLTNKVSYATPIYNVLEIRQNPTFFSIDCNGNTVAMSYSATYTGELHISTSSNIFVLSINTRPYNTFLTTKIYSDNKDKINIMSNFGDSSIKDGNGNLSISTNTWRHTSNFITLYCTTLGKSSDFYLCLGEYDTTPGKYNIHIYHQVEENNLADTDDFNTDTDNYSYYSCYNSLLDYYASLYGIFDEFKEDYI